MRLGIVLARIANLFAFVVQKKSILLASVLHIQSTVNTCYSLPTDGQKQMITPNFDKLAQESLVLNRACKASFHIISQPFPSLSSRCEFCFTCSFVWELDGSLNWNML